MIRLLVALFMLSGMAGLIYESIWSRYLGLFVGHSAYAQVIVLVIFLGGMSGGALVVARRSDGIRDPLRAYAWVEAIVGLLGLAFDPLFRVVTAVAYETWFPALAGTPGLTIVKWSAAGVLILPQSILLGATFPLMSAGVLRLAPKAPGHMLALLYFANSLGAAAGALLSGFFLVGAFGLPGTVATAAMINLAVAGAVIVARRASEPVPDAAVQKMPKATATASRVGKEAGPSGAPDLLRLLLIVSFGTAVASFIYEIAWIRMLSLVLGSTTRSFEVMLSAFILGLALGAFWVRSRADRFRSPLEALGVLQWAMGSVALATLPLYMASFHWTSGTLLSLTRDDGGYRVFTLFRYALCLVVMLPATFCAGTTLPLITRTLLAQVRGERAIGLVYGVNTLGSILGAALAGLLLMPLLGLKGLLIAGALIDVGLGVALLSAAGRSATGARRLVPVAVGLTALLVAGALFLVHFDLYLLTSGVYRSGMLADRNAIQVLHYRDGRTATVSVEHYESSQSLTLSTNGKGDASLRLLWMRPEGQRPRTAFHSDESTQALAGILTLAHAPGARNAAVIGQGSGMTSHYLLGSPGLEQLTTIEIEPEVIEASRLFLPANRRVFEDPRSRFELDDAKSYFAASQRRFDLIVSEPSNPWVSGVAGLFSAEFYQRIRGNLTPDGVFGQWLHVYELDDDLALSVLAAIHTSFRTYEVFMVGESDMLIVATNRAAGLVPDWGVIRFPGIAADLSNVHPFTVDVFEGLRVGGREVFAPLLESGVRAHSDFFPFLDEGAEKARFLAGTADGFLHLHASRFSFAYLAARRRVGPARSFLVPVPHIPRLRNLAASAALRMNPFPKIAPASIDERLPEALTRRAGLQAAIASGAAPPDWRVWTNEALHAEDDWHLGTAGVVDEGLHELLRNYLARTNAPPPAVAAFAFVHDLASWNLQGAARNAEPLVILASRGEDWLPPDVLFDGVVAARLMTGDATGARRAFDVLLPRIGRDPHDLRTRLLDAHLRAADASR